MSQTSYSLNPAIAIAGQLYDNANQDVVCYPAGGVIPFGAAVQMSSGTVVIPSATTLGKVLGIALRSDVKPQPSGGGSCSWATGDMVPVLRQGRVWALYNGGTAATLAAVNIKHASDDSATNAQYRGWLTASATSATAGTEVSAVNGVAAYHTYGEISGLVLAEVNYPNNVGT